MLEYDDNSHSQRSPGRFARGPVVALVLLALSLIGSLVWVCISATRPGSRKLGNPPGMVDRIDFFDTAAAWDQGNLERIELLRDAPTRLRLRDVPIPPPRDAETQAKRRSQEWQPKFPREGSWTSPEMQTAFDFTELLPSYNPGCPPDTGVRIDVRARDTRSGAWSPWFYLGSWGRGIGKPEKLTKSPFGEVDIDTLILYRAANAYQVRMTLYSFALDEQVNPTLRRLAVSYSGVVADAARRAQLVTPVSMPADFACDIPVPFRAQGNAAKPLRPEICSPTSVSMVMQYLGRDLPTEENALAMYDSEYDMFGNWGKAVAWAGQNGFDAWLTRFRTWDQVKATIATGQPIIASIRFKKGECPSFVFDHSAGHLLVIRGVTKDGDIIVNDPASRTRGNGAVYKADEMAKAWIAHGGVGYIIRKPRM
jgi:hypothetical protein